MEGKLLWRQMMRRYRLVSFFLLKPHFPRKRQVPAESWKAFPTAAEWKSVSGILMWIVYWYFIDFFFSFQPCILKFLDFYSVPYPVLVFSQPRWRWLKTTRFFTVTIWGLVNSVNRAPSHFCSIMLHNYWSDTDELKSQTNGCSDDIRADETTYRFFLFLKVTYV